MKLSDEFKVGLFATITVTLLIIGLSFLKGKELFSDKIMLKADYRKVDGLGKANPVYFYGLQVGKVEDIKTNYDDNDSLVITVEFSVMPDVRIPKGSTARIVDSDLLGSKAIEIFPTNSPQFVTDGDYLVAANDMSISDQASAIITPLTAKTEKLMQSLTVTINQIEKTLDDSTRRNIKSSLQNFAETSEDLKVLISQSKGSIKSTLNNFNSVSGDIKGTSGKLNRTLDKMSAIADSLEKAPIRETIDNLNKSVAELKGLIEKANDGDGTLALLLNDSSLYYDLQRTILEFEKLSQDFQEHPKHYLAPLGKKNRKNWAK